MNDYASLVIGLIPIGLIWGAIPLVIGITRKQSGLGAGGFIACVVPFVVGGLITGLILAIPICAIFVWLIFNASQKVQAQAERVMHKKCPYCAEKILVKAKVCKHCGRDLPNKISDNNLDSFAADEEPLNNSNALERFITKADQMKLGKAAEEYYKLGKVLFDKNEYDEAILEFVKAIRVSSPQEEWYQSAQKGLKEMGFSDADIQHI